MNKMKRIFPVVVAVGACLLPGAGRLAAAESYRLESSVYVFKHGDFQSIKLPATMAGGAHEAGVVRSPATVGFDQETLSLNGAGFSWSGGRNPPERFTLIEIPQIITAPGKPVEMLSAAPIQYIEKQADGTLQVRDIGGDSAEAPHCRIRFTVMSPDAAGGELRVTCNLDIATLSGRANVPGVSLAVGRPLLARFQDRVELAVRPGEWAALLLQAPNGSDYSLLLLLKTGPVQASGTRALEANRPMTREELALITTYYYRHPLPEQITRAIESLLSSHSFDRGSPDLYEIKQRTYSYVGFFAEIFAANPERLTEWREIFDRWDQGSSARFWMRKALKLSRPGAILELGPNSPESVDLTDIYWGAFCASGNPAYLRILVGRLELVDDARQSYFEEGAEVMVLFATNGPHHPLVRQTLETARKEVSPRVRELIDDLLHKDLAAVLQEMRDKDHDPAYLNAGGEGRNDLPWRRPSPPPPWSARP